VSDEGTGPPPPPPLNASNNKLQARAPRVTTGVRRKRAVSNAITHTAASNPIGEGRPSCGAAGGESLIGRELVVMLVEGAKVEIVSVEVLAVPLLRLTVLGENLGVIPSVTPPLVGQASVTGLALFPDGVILIVAVAELPAVIDVAEKFDVRLKS